MSQTVNSMIRVVSAAFALSGCAGDIPVLAPTDVPMSSATSELALPTSPGWNAQARQLVAGGNMSAIAAARVYAALGLAQYRAVLAVDDTEGDIELSENGVGAGGRSAVESRRGAVAGASATVLSYLFSSATGSLEQRVVAEGNAGPGGMHPQFARGVEAGRAVGAAVVERLKADRFTTPWDGTVQTGPDKWRNNGTPAGATFGGVTPIFMMSGSQFRPVAPPAWQSAAFNADLAEIKSLSVNRTDAQRAIALYWNLGNGTHTPPGFWNQMTGQYIAGANLNERAATHAFALTNGAMFDALIGCWEAKYHYWTMRPSQADPSITLTFGLPNHPSYPSGHSCQSAAAATVLSHLFPERTTEVQGYVEEGGLSRMYAGIHYRFDITAGQNLGVAVGQWAIANQDLLR